MPARLKSFRFVAVSLLVFCLILGGCAQERKVQEEKKLTVYYIQIWAEGLNEAFKSACDEWGRRNNVDVSVEVIALKDINFKIASLIESGKGADLAVFPAHLIMVHRDRLADMSDICSDLEVEYGGFYDVAKEMTHSAGVWYGVPIFAWSHVWVYRKDMLEAIGEKPAETYEDAVRIARKLNDPEKGIWGFGIGLGKDDDAAMFFQSLLWAFGGKVVEEDGQTVAINSPETIAAVQFVVDLYQKYEVIPKGALGWDGASNNKNFLAGEIALTMNAPTIYYVAKRERPDLVENIQHGLYPAGPSGRFSYATGFALAAVKENPNLELTKRLIRFIFEKTTYANMISAGEGSVNPMVKGFEDLEIWKDPQLRVGLESIRIERAVGWPGPVTPAASEVFQRRILTDMFGRVIKDGLSVEEAVREAEQRIREVYASYR